MDEKSSTLSPADEMALNSFRQDIQEATASEPLTLEEEYAMQRSWRGDADKLTFIVCRPDHGHQRDGNLDVDSMVGDVNLFISLGEDDDDTQHVVGELEIMIAEQTEQGKGYGRAALLAFLRYIVSHESDIVREFGQAATSVGDGDLIQFHHFAVKIGQANGRSISLFESLGFRKTTAAPSYFGEYELRLDNVNGEVLSLAGNNSTALDGYREVDYVLPAQLGI